MRTLRVGAACAGPQAPRSLMTTLFEQIRPILPPTRTFPGGVGRDSRILTFTHPRNEGLFVVGCANGHGSPCTRCCERKVEVLWNRTSASAATLDVADATKAVRAAAEAGIPLAITNATIAQNWSVVTSWPDCRTCRDHRLETPTLPGVSEPSSDFGRPASGDVSLLSGIPRSGRPSSFVEAHRDWFGFASVLLNPSMNGRHGVFTADTGMFLDEKEPLAPVGGKGVSAGQALASCLGEGIERYAISGALDLPDALTSRAAASPHEEGIWRGARDFDGRPLEPGPGQSVELVEMEELGGGPPRHFPASLVYAPYTSPAWCWSPTPSSTTGAAVGTSLEEATAQAVLELIERDSFWYYSRHGGCLPTVQTDDDPLAAGLTAEEGVSIYAKLLENSFGVPVVHVALLRNSAKGRTRTARGMGASMTLGSATRKAVIEATQMLRSLDTGVDIEPSITDMRSLWFSGESIGVFPQFFGDPRSSPSLPSDPENAGTARGVLDLLVRRGERAGVRFYRHVFAQTSGYAAVRCIADRILPLDDEYFPTLNRFGDWGAESNREQWSYRGPLFM